MKAIKLLFTLILILSILTACGNKSDKEITAEETLIHQHDIPNEVAAPKIQGLRLPYVVQLSSNPYTASIKANTDICSLIYDPLVKIKTDYTNEMYLAESISSAENVHTVTLKKGIAFSDGSILNADDAVNSFERAKAGDSFYSSSLAEVISCTKKDDYTIVFEAESIDENFANLLTFPIVKQKEDGEFIGCGRYKLNAQKNALIRNTSHFKSKSGIDKIDLVEFKSSSELINSLRRGEIDCIFTDTPDWSVSYISRKTSAVDMNKLVLLGINCQREQLSEGAMRQVILKAVDQQALIKDAFKSTAIPTSTPFNPAFYKLDSAGAAASTHAPNEIPKMMSELGFTEKDENGMYTGLSLNLIVNNESPIKRNAAYAIAKQLGRAGISVTVEESSFEVYMNNLVSQNFDLYIAEVGIPYNMNLSSVLSQNTNSGFGVTYNSTLIDEYAQVRAGSVPCSKFIKTFNEVVPFVPLAYRNGTLALSADFPAEITATPQDIFYNIDSW